MPGPDTHSHARVAVARGRRTRLLAAALLAAALAGCLAARGSPATRFRAGRPDVPGLRVPALPRTPYAYAESADAALARLAGRGAGGGGQGFRGGRGGPRAGGRGGGGFARA